MNFEAFLYTLPLMGKGMVGIYIVTCVIIGVMHALARFSDKKSNDHQDQP